MGLSLILIPNYSLTLVQREHQSVAESGRVCQSSSNLAAVKSLRADKTSGLTLTLYILARFSDSHERFAAQRCEDMNLLTNSPTHTFIRGSVQLPRMYAQLM